MRLRAPELTDVDFIYRVENHPERLLYGRTGLPYSRELITDYISNYNLTALDSGNVRFILEDTAHGTSNSIGIVDLYNIDFSTRKAFISIYIEEEYRRQGHGTTAVKQAVAFARDNLGLNQIVAVVAEFNIASNALFAHLQFKQIALLPQWSRNTAGELANARLMNKIL